MHTLSVWIALIAHGSAVHLQPGHVELDGVVFAAEIGAPSAALPSDIAPSPEAAQIQVSVDPVLDADQAYEAYMNETTQGMEGRIPDLDMMPGAPAAAPAAAPEGAPAGVVRKVLAAAVPNSTAVIGELVKDRPFEETAVLMVLGGMLLVIMLGAVIFYLLEGSPEHQEDSDNASHPSSSFGNPLFGVEEGQDAEEVVARGPDGLDPDVYCAGVATVVRDIAALAAGTGSVPLRVTRLITGFLIVAVAIALQVWVITMMKKLVAAPQIREIREIYSRFEFVMYGSNKSHMIVTADGFHRGLDKMYYKPEYFEHLSRDEQDLACRIPFSQPQLLFPLLLIWTLAVVNDLRRTGDLFVRLILATPTISSMRESIKEIGDDRYVIVGLTRRVKSALFGLTMIPRVLIDVTLLWIGSKWLMATPDFTELLLNSVALEFILLLKNILFSAVMPDRSRRATENTLIQPWNKREPANYVVFMSAFGLLAVAVLWTWSLMFYLQDVLPQYRADVEPVCAKLIAEQMSEIRIRSKGIRPFSHL